MRYLIIGEDLLVDIETEYAEVKDMASILRKRGHKIMRIIPIDDGGPSVKIENGKKGKQKVLRMLKLGRTLGDDGKSVGQEKRIVIGKWREETIPPKGHDD